MRGTWHAGQAPVADEHHLGWCASATGVRPSMLCASLPGGVHDTLGGRQGLTSTTQGCTSLHRCSESVHAFVHRQTGWLPAGRLAGQLVSWPAGRLAVRPVGWLAGRRMDERIAACDGVALCMAKMNRKRISSRSVPDREEILLPICRKPISSHIWGGVASGSTNRGAHRPAAVPLG